MGCPKLGKMSFPLEQGNGDPLGTVHIEEDAIHKKHVQRINLKNHMSPSNLDKQLHLFSLQQHVKDWPSSSARIKSD